MVENRKMLEFFYDFFFLNLEILVWCVGEFSSNFYLDHKMWSNILPLACSSLSIWEWWARKIFQYTYRFIMLWIWATLPCPTSLFRASLWYALDLSYFTLPPLPYSSDVVIEILEPSILDRWKKSIKWLRTTTSSVKNHVSTIKKDCWLP
jgi:hypothetical protein